MEDRNAPEQELFFHLQMHSLTRGPHSIQAKLNEFNKQNLSKSKITPVEMINYVSICSFHTWDSWREGSSSQVAHETIYVHSKLAIADDERCIIGSANINDRSLMGDRDSEVAVVIQGKKFASSLRHQIWSVALGIENNENFHAMAPETDEFFKSTWICRAATNASKYWEIFRSLPNNSVTSYYDQSHQSVRKWQNEYNMRKEYGDENRLKELQAVKGTLILHQHLFALHDEQIRTTSDIVNKTFNTLMPKLYV